MSNWTTIVKIWTVCSSESDENFWTYAGCFLPYKTIGVHLHNYHLMANIWEKGKFDSGGKFGFSYLITTVCNIVIYDYCL